MCAKHTAGTRRGRTPVKARSDHPVHGAAAAGRRTPRPLDLKATSPILPACAVTGARRAAPQSLGSDVPRQCRQRSATVVPLIVAAVGHACLQSQAALLAGPDLLFGTQPG